MLDNTVTVGFQLIPRKGGSHIHLLIDKAIEVVANSGIKYRVTPLETVMEGAYDEIMAVIKQAQQASMEIGAEEVFVNIRIHAKKDKSATIGEKMEKYE